MERREGVRGICFDGPPGHPEPPAAGPKHVKRSALARLAGGGQAPSQTERSRGSKHCLQELLRSSEDGDNVSLREAALAAGGIGDDSRRERGLLR